ncbi:MAG: GAF domain-containing sensor histidine kinase [Alphaproteobacteria bacterium]|nr:MAG: GAF domain-containing sensor histidine kinase [Alphaproteobacteria bacterium]
MVQRAVVGHTGQLQTMGLFHRIDTPERLEAVTRYEAVVPACRPVLHSLLRLVSEEFEVDHAALTMVERQVVCFVASVGETMGAVPREHGLCSHTIANAAPTVFHNLAEDPAFASNPLVQGEPHLAFYAGAPVRVGEGLAIGALCVFDTRPRAEFTEAQRARLARYAELAAGILECAATKFGSLPETPEDLQREIARLRHGLAAIRSQLEEEILTPLHAAIGFARLIHQQAYGSIDNPLYRQYARHIATSVERVLRALDRLSPRQTDRIFQEGLNDNELGLAIDGVVRALVADRPAEEGARIQVGQGPSVRLIASARGMRQGLEEVVDHCLSRAGPEAGVRLIWERTEEQGLALLMAQIPLHKKPAAEGEEEPPPPADSQEMLKEREGRARRLLPLAQRVLAQEEGRLELFGRADAPWLARITWPAYRLLWNTGGGGETSTPADTGAPPAS